MATLLMRTQVDEVIVNIKLSVHAELRFKERLEPLLVDIWSIGCDVLKLNFKLLEYAKKNKSFAIQDNENDFTIICSAYEFKGEVMVKIITLVDKCDTWVKKGTQIERLK